jgi:hypothetical protein
LSEGATAGHKKNYFVSSSGVENLADLLPSARKFINTILKRIFNKSSQKLDQDIFEKNFSELLSGVNKGFGKTTYGDPSFELLQNLRQSTVFFAANKTFTQAQELADLLVNPDGTVRNWQDFKTLARPLVGKYNTTWLKTEYDIAIRSARAARDYRQAQDSIEEYPNLKYIHTVSADPRHSHLELVGIVRPVNDPFWATHLPPSDYNCKCSFAPTTDEVTDLPAELPSPVEAMAHNPALTGKVFTEQHPYFQKVGNLDPAATQAVEDALKQYVQKIAAKGLLKQELSNGVIRAKFTPETLAATLAEPNSEQIKKLLLLIDTKALKTAFYNAPIVREANGLQYYSFLIGEQPNYLVIDQNKIIQTILNII